LNFSDLIHKAVTGEWKLDRARAAEALELNKRSREKRMMLYAGAEPGPNRPSASQLSTPEDYKQAYERIYLIRAARQMEEDFPFFDAILSDFETFVVGDLRYRAATGNPEADKVINDFLDWQFDQADMTDRFDLTKLARLAVRSYKRDGECGFMVFDTEDTVKLSAISGDRIGNPTMATGFAPNDFGGIVVDLATGRPQFFNIYRRLPKLNSYEFQQRVDPNNFIHYFDPFRIEQYHGVTVFKNAIEHGFDIKQITDFTKLNIKWRSSQLPYVKNEQGRPRGNGYEEGGTDAKGVPYPLSIKTDGVVQTFVKLDDGIMEYPNDFPNQQYRPLIEDLKRDCAIAAKLPLEFVYRSDAGGVVQRFYVDKAAATFSEEKRWLRRVLLNPYKNRCIQKGVKSGLLNLEKFGLSDKIERFHGQWQMGRAISVDYGREVSADIAQMDAGVMSPQDYTLETQGRTSEEVLVHIGQHTEAIFKEAKRIALSTGETIDTVLPYLCKKFPNPAPVTSAPTDDRPGRSGGQNGQGE
jgi:capsid protein